MLHVTVELLTYVYFVCLLLHFSKSISPDVEITCTDVGFYVKIFKDYESNSLWDNFSLFDAECKVPVKKTDFFSLTYTKYSECGSTVRLNETHVIFENILMASAGKDTAIIERLRQTVIFISCALRRNINVSQDGFVNVTRSNDIVITKENFGEFTVSFNLYRNFTFSTKYEPLDYPVSVLLSSMLFMAVELSSTNPDIKINLISCFATPTNNIGDPIKHWIVRNSCPNDTTYLQGPIDQYTHRFAIQALRFVFNRVQKHQVVYFHSTLVVCNSSVTTGQCEWEPVTCEKSIRKRRRREFSNDGIVLTEPNLYLRHIRAGNSMSDHYTVTSRKVLLVADDLNVRDEVDESQNSNVLITKIGIIILSAGVALFILACCIAVIIHHHIRVKSKTNHIETR